ncbi:hypothetical protein [Chromobacterium sphagni]|uniref:hypothetical protein n=1 Tax=Chromobacterium sphagni TaxID=1903179 RepID=UPI000B287810|nr:hypothetical protein [Chromobacterium sphagni]
MPAWQRVEYRQLNARQQENYNFQKLAAVLADYGFNCLRLTDDWQGADFIACHVDGRTVLKVQLKGRMAFDRKYCGKSIHIAFRDQERFYLYPHDQLSVELQDAGILQAPILGREKGDITSFFVQGYSQ